MRYIREFINKLDSLLSTVAAVTLFIMMAWVFLDVLFRTIFNSPIKGTTDIAGEYLMVILVYLSISYVQKNDGHVKVRLVLDKLGNVKRTFIVIFCNLIGSLVFIFLGYFNFLEAIDYMDRGVRSISTLNYPLAPALWVIAIGTLLLALRLLVESLILVFNLYNRNDSISIGTSNKEYPS